jgi:hypothetical protein
VGGGGEGKVGETGSLDLNNPDDFKKKCEELRKEVNNSNFKKVDEKFKNEVKELVVAYQTQLSFGEELGNANKRDNAKDYYIKAYRMGNYLGDLLEKLKESYANEVILETTEGKKIKVNELWAQIFIQTNGIGKELTEKYGIKNPKKELLGISEENTSSVVEKEPEKKIKSNKGTKGGDRDNPKVEIIRGGDGKNHIKVTYEGKTYTGSGVVPAGITPQLLTVKIVGNKIIVSYSGRQLNFSEEFTIEK